MSPQQKAFHILVVDDDANQRNLLGSFLNRQGFEISYAACAEEAIERLMLSPFHLLISDIRMPGISGLEMLQLIREKNIALPVLLVTAYADIRDAVNAMRDGAVNYLEKPIDLDELLSSVESALDIHHSDLPDLPENVSLPEHVVAQSSSMKNVLREIAMVAPSESRILITGESGAGKEVIADVIHRWSTRAAQAFIKVNCAAIAETLLESELFGHEKGAFTGATQRRSGYFEEADRGTIFLDEIGEMSPSLQAKMLRITQDGTYQRVGSSIERKTNARILAATNRNLEEDVENGKFREDLFYRLNVMEVYVPPLRERREDILPLANRFAEQFLQGKPRFSETVIHCFHSYNWPGNVRELRNAVERATLMARGELILLDHLPKRIRETYQPQSEQEKTKPESKRMADIEREAILKALHENNNNRTETAKSLGISRRALTYKLQHYIEQGFNIDE